MLICIAVRGVTWPHLDGRGHSHKWWTRQAVVQGGVPGLGETKTEKSQEKFCNLWQPPATVCRCARTEYEEKLTSLKNSYATLFVVTGSLPAAPLRLTLCRRRSRGLVTRDCALGGALPTRAGGGHEPRCCDSSGFREVRRIYG